MSDAQAVRPLTPNTSPEPPETNSGETSFRDHKCDGYTCEHPLCAAEREYRVTHLSRRGERARQPWHTDRAA